MQAKRKNVMYAVVNEGQVFKIFHVVDRSTPEKTRDTVEFMAKKISGWKNLNLHYDVNYWDESQHGWQPWPR